MSLGLKNNDIFPAFEIIFHWTMSFSLIGFTYIMVEKQIYHVLK